MAFVLRGVGTRKALSLIGLSPGSYYRRPAGGSGGRPAEATTAKVGGGRHGNGEVLADIMELLSMPYVDYGYRKVAVWLRDRRQWVINHKKAYRLMREAGLLNRKRAWAALSRRRAHGCSPEPEGPGRHLEIDIKSVWVHRERRNALVLSAVDLFHREWFEYVADYSITAADVERMVRAIVAPMPEGVRIRTDNGGQFVAHRLAAALGRAKVGHEFIRPATPQQNGHIESFHSIMQSALVARVEFESMEDLRAHLTAFRDFYNNDRIHSGTADYPPMVFLEKWRQGLIRVGKGKNGRRKFFRAGEPVAPTASEPIIGVTQ
jgi:transposase InsO family protein